MNRYEHLETAYYLHFHGRSVPSKSRNLKFINTDTRQRKDVFLLPQCRRPALGRTQPPIHRVRCFSLGMKLPGHEADHIHPYSADVKNAWSHTSAAPHPRLHSIVRKDKEQLTFTLRRPPPYLRFRMSQGQLLPPPPYGTNTPRIPRLTALSSSPDTLMNEWSMSKGKVILISRGYEGFT